MDNDKELLEEHLDKMSTRVQQNVTVVTPEDIGDDFFLHISKNTNIRKFIPQLTLRGSATENRDVTRICVAANLLGCLIGYAAVENDFFHASNGSEEEEGWRGGFKIYALPFKAALKPNTKMVYDTKHSEEHWLVTYSKETIEFIPVSAGRIFYHSIVYVARSEKKPVAYGTAFVEVTMEGGIQYNKTIRLAKGYWKIESLAPQNSSLLEKNEKPKVTSISKSDYQAAKAVSAALLSYSDPTTLQASQRW